MTFPKHLKERLDKVKQRGDISALQKTLGFSNRGSLSNILSGRAETRVSVVEKIEKFIEKREAVIERLSQPTPQEVD